MAEVWLKYGYSMAVVPPKDVK